MVPGSWNPSEMWRLLLVLTSSVLVSASGCSPEKKETITPASREIVTVPDEVPTISEALICVVPGGEVRIREGWYRESLRVTGNVRLIGMGDPVGTVVSSSSQPTLVSMADEVVVENVTFHYNGSDRLLADDVLDPLARRNVATRKTTPETVRSENAGERTDSTISTETERTERTTGTGTSPDMTETPTIDIPEIPEELAGRERSDDPMGMAADTEPRAAVVLHRGSLTLRQCGIKSPWANGIVADSDDAVVDGDGTRGGTAENAPVDD
ncbi:MAG: hypothetical protein Q4C47_08425, partial [Planctomycetia bacterium]|nr:hypothetical protein [Planctomycetia bacterium]